ncbi:hypothetical protein [Novipirellula artificiosorum]|uniref:Uncharacterized protein n=1 Tax=Novipirellula artificiosorum TaxID=2528016 RepID=A0A5C6DZ14_9BACT|nr:hypothetical protein [Novipirellula artificiosorum]TWU41890.1 hypothetical protein Poly41_01830 [Novipirellula artificiosorum]
MIVSAVADPTAFGPKGITDELSKREAIAFLSGIISNGVLLDEPTKELLRLAISEVSQLGTNMGQRIQLLLLEIKKQHKKFVVTCDRTRWQQQPTTTIPEKCSALAVNLKADVVVTQPSNLAAVRAATGAAAEVCLLADASQSNYEASRNRLLQIHKPLDELTPAEIEEFVGRAVKYASTIRFFDFRMIGSPKRTTKYVAGMQFFITIWEKWCVAGEPASRRVEVYTLGNTTTLKGFISGTDADALLASHIQAPLNAATSATVYRFVKEDRHPAIFHARGFEARLRAFTIDPGFDAVDTGGAIRRCLLKADLAAESHFADCRKLKDLP